jgi:uncharacterized membrane protein
MAKSGTLINRIQGWTFSLQQLNIDERSKWAIFVLTIFYTIGTIGIAGKIHPDFILLTPGQLLLSVGLMLWCHHQWRIQMALFLVLVYIIGFGAELAGVQTGLIFGEYAYGPVLGPKWYGTPFMIGVNWILVTYATGSLVDQLAGKWHWLVRTVLIAALMVGLDFLIEPVAMALDFWSWPGNVVPVQNYIGWFIIALFTSGLYVKMASTKPNKVGIALFILQFLFFLLLNIFLV